MPAIRINDDAAGLQRYAFDLPATCAMQVLKNRTVSPHTDHERHIIICILCYIIIVYDSNNNNISVQLCLVYYGKFEDD